MKLLPVIAKQSDPRNEGLDRSQFVAQTADWRAPLCKIALGILGPAIFLYVDPFVLGGQDGDSIVGNLSVCVYAAVLLSMSCFFWQSLRVHRHRVLSAFASGGMLAGSLLSCVLGMVLLPFSVLAIRLYGAGVFGFYPFLVSALYYRSACLQLIGQPVSNRWRWPRFVWASCGFLLVLGVPLLMRESANREIDFLVASVDRTAGLDHTDWQRERWLTTAGDYDRIVFEYQQVDNEQARKNLTVLYESLTGRAIDRRLYQLTHPD